MSSEKNSREYHERISTRTRHAVISEHLRDGLAFLSEQDRLLAYAGQVLDELRSLIELDGPDIALRKQILLQGLMDVTSARYKKTLLFGSGTESPLKLHVVVDDERQIIEIEQANLRQPGFQCVLQCGSSVQNHPFRLKPALAASAIAEILNLRFRNQRQTRRLEHELKRAEGKIACADAARRLLFADQSPAEPKSRLQRISGTVHRFANELAQRLKAFRSTQPVWEEISPATTINHL